jgi:hypothetical protein
VRLLASKKFGLYRLRYGSHVDPSPIHKHHGQPEKETSFEDEQAQAPQAFEVSSTQETLLATVSFAFGWPQPSDLHLSNPSQVCGGFFCV